MGLLYLQHGFMRESLLNIVINSTVRIKTLENTVKRKILFFMLIN